MSIVRYINSTLTDLQTEGARLLQVYVDEIKALSASSSGRRLSNFVMGLVEVCHFGMDLRFRQSNAEDVTDIEQALKIFKVVAYASPGPSAAGCVVNFSAIAGAPAAPIVIPQYTLLKTSKSPSMYGVVVSATQVDAGSTSVDDVDVIQGQYSTGNAVGVGDGTADQAFLVAARYIPKDTLSVYVNAVKIDIVDDFEDADDTDLVAVAQYDHEGYLSVVFGDGVYGKALVLGDTVTADWILCDGADGNFTASTASFDTIMDTALGKSLTVLQTSACTGGSDGPDVETIQRTASGLRFSDRYVRNGGDAKALSEDYPGVYRVLVIRPGGSLLRVYVMPDGGGVASPTLLANLLAYLQGRAVEGLELETYSLTPVPLLGTARVVLNSGRSRVPRNVISRAIWDAMREDISYVGAVIGRGEKISDVATLIEEISGGDVVDYVDLSRFTREPRTVKSNPASPDVYNPIVGSSVAVGQEWKIIAYTTTTFFVSLDGAVLATLGTVGTPYTSNGFTFTVGELGDTLVVGDEYDTYVSPYVGNIQLLDDEYQYFRREADFVIDVVYSEEDV